MVNSHESSTQQVTVEPILIMLPKLPEEWIQCLSVGNHHAWNDFAFTRLLGGPWIITGILK
jgi:hypothetical protein